MKQYRYYYLAALSLGLLSSCADDLTQNLAVENVPLSVQVMEELNRLDPLKSYKTASNMSSDFKLGGAVSVDDFAKGGNIGALAAANLDEVASKAELLYGNCVSDDGTTDFGKVVSFVDAAKKANVGVFGSALISNTNQRPKYYQSLFETRGLQIKEEKKKEREAQGNASVSSNYCIEYDCGTAGANPWDKQAHYNLSTPMEVGKDYTISAKIKSTQGGDCGLWPIWTGSDNKDEWGGSKDLYYLDTYAVTKEWAEYTWKIEKSKWAIDRLQFVFGKMGGQIYFDDVKVFENGSDVNMVANSSFDEKSIDGWANNWQGPSYTRFEEKVVTAAANHCIEYECGEAGANSWDKQAHYTLTRPMEVGKAYSISAKIRASQSGDCALWPIWTGSDNKDQWGGSKDLYYLDTYSVGKDWADYSWKIDKTDWAIDKLQFVFGKLGGQIYFDDVKVVEVETGEDLVANGSFEESSIAGWANNWQGPSYTRFEEEPASDDEPDVQIVNLVENSDCEGSENGNYVIRLQGAGGDVKASFSDGGKEGKCIKIDVAAKTANAWDNQFFITVPDFKDVIDPESKVELKMDVKAAVAQKISVQTHAAPGDYVGGFGDINAETDWKTFTLKASMPKHAEKGQSYSLAFNLNDGDGVTNTFYFDNITLSIEQKIPAGEISAEEKSKILVNVMEKWVSGLMTNTAGYVKAWDVVSDPISDGAVQKDGAYGLQSTEKPNTKKAYNDVFFWQDYLGDVDYVRYAVSAARRNFKGSAGELKLFVNEYGLDTDAKKCESLVKWLGKWENDTVKIDGVGVQLHLTCSENATENENTLSNLATMFQTLAATGKLVRVSELDVVYTDNSGSVVKVSSADYAAKNCDVAIGDFYKNVIKAYLANVPSAQQYGICQWSLTDEGDSPKGLWTDKFLRKQAYSGFANGLSGK